MSKVGGYWGKFKLEKWDLFFFFGVCLGVSWNGFCVRFDFGGWILKEVGYIYKFLVLMI